MREGGKRPYNTRRKLQKVRDVHRKAHAAMVKAKRQYRRRPRHSKA